MQVKEIMTSDVSFCGTKANLSDVANVMWNKDCGSVPVVDQDKKVVGVITDRDICMALVFKNKLANEIFAKEMIGGLVRVCSPEDDIEMALATMEHAQLRRLPVVDKDGTLCGIISINDAIRHTDKGEKKSRRVSRKKVLQTLRAISQKNYAPEKEVEIVEDTSGEVEEAATDIVEEVATETEPSES